MAKFDYQSFCAQKLQVVDKNAHQVPFVLNKIQQKYLEIRGKRNIILKARQQGFSTFIVAESMLKFLLKRNFFIMIIADEADNAAGLLSRAKFFLKSFEESYHTKVPLKYNSKYELHHSQNNSTLLIGSARNINVGRSKTINKLHLSEAAFYPDLEGLLNGVLQAVPPDGEVDIETTANGFNYFKTFWDKATLGESDFRPLFFPASDFYSSEFLAVKKNELGRFFSQEYPENPQEAFLTSGQTYFDKDALAYYLSQARKPVKGEDV
ncbi:hypothetical protein IJJ27_04325 [bacterium]|nr:hypothetical protein [bacterium]